jgi:hypothetical protein
MPTSTKGQKIEKKMTINVIQHDDRLWYLRMFYNGAFSIASKNDLDDQNLLLATVYTIIPVPNVLSNLKKISLQPASIILLVTNVYSPCDSIYLSKICQNMQCCFKFKTMLLAKVICKQTFWMTGKYCCQNSNQKLFSFLKNNSKIFTKLRYWHSWW